MSSGPAAQVAFDGVLRMEHVGVPYTRFFTSLAVNKAYSRFIVACLRPLALLRNVLHSTLMADEGALMGLGASKFVIPVWFFNRFW